MHGVPAQTGFPCTLTKTIYISAISSTLNPIISVANLSRLECAETQFARKPRAYEYIEDDKTVFPLPLLAAKLSGRRSNLSRA